MKRLWSIYKGRSRKKTKTQEDVERYFKTLNRSAGKENSGGKTFSSNEIGEAFVICMGAFEVQSGKGKSKAKGTKGKGKGKQPSLVMEHHGVMFTYHKELEKSRIWLKQISGRLMQVCFKTRGPKLVITNALAPHTWKSGDRTREDMLEIRQDFFQKHTEVLL